MASSKAGLHQKAAGELLVFDDLTTSDFAIVGAAENNLGGKELDATTSGLPAIGSLTDIGTAEDEAADWLLIYDNDAATWKKVQCREFQQNPNYEELAYTSVDADTDRILVWDGDAGYNKKITVHSFVRSVTDRAVKTANQTYTLDNSLNNDDHLQFTVFTTEQFAFHACLFGTAGVTNDFKFDFDGGTATFGTFTYEWCCLSNNAGATEFDQGTTTSSTSDSVIDITANGEFVLHIGGYFTTTGSGTVILRHSQNSSGSSTTGLYTGSYMEIGLV